MEEKHKNVKGRASVAYDCAWKCRKCGKLHVQHGQLELEGQWQDNTMDYVRQQLPLLLTEQVKSVNQGWPVPLQIPGVCEGCGTLQPWGNAAREKLVPARQKRLETIGLIAGMVILGLVTIGMLIPMFDFTDGFPMETWIIEAVFLYLMSYLYKALKYRTGEIKHADSRLRNDVKKMKKRGQADRLPLLRTGSRDDGLPEGKDERTRALAKLNAVYEPEYTVTCED